MKMNYPYEEHKISIIIAKHKIIWQYYPKTLDTFGGWTKRKEEGRRKLMRLPESVNAAVLYKLLIFYLELYFVCNKVLVILH